MPKLDLYRVMDLLRSATPEQIKAQYRQLAQLHHPDHGGDPNAWTLLLKAYETLSDPERREHYDRTGEILDKKADNTNAAVAHLLPQIYDELISECIQQRVSPYQIDFVRAAIAKLEHKASEIQKQIVGLKNGRRITEGMVGRFVIDDGDNLFENMLQRKLAALDTHIANATGGLQAVNAAIAHLRNYEFRPDHVQTVQYTFTTSQA